MKKQITAIVAALSLIVVLTAIGFASSGATLTADIPFDFTVRGKTMPAGKYIVSPGKTQYTMVVRNIKGDAVTTLVQDDSGKTSWKAKLTFRRYGDLYFLASVDDGQGNMQRVPVTNAERKAAGGKDHLAMTAPEIITVNANIGQ